jgi:RNA polymerase-binding transcription factor DksA
MAKNSKPVAKKSARPVSPKKPARPVAPAKPAPAAKRPPTAAKPKAVEQPTAVAKAAPRSPSMEKPSKKSALRDSILKRKTAAKPIAFSLDEVRAIAQTVTAKTSTPQTIKSGKSTGGKPAAAVVEKIKPQHVKAASLADILGFNPKKKQTPANLSDKDVPEKFKRYHKLLIDLRTSLTEGIERHSEETLKRSSKDDAGDLSAYGQHMADAGTDTFDRDFALSMVASEQEALSEIDAAIKRIHDGSYGVCEITQKPISRDRLLAVPFTRYSAEAQKEIERNRLRSRTQAGLFGEMGEDSGKMSDDVGGDE